jgi:hypothetical protein
LRGHNLIIYTLNIYTSRLHLETKY